MRAQTFIHSPLKSKTIREAVRLNFALLPTRLSLSDPSLKNRKISLRVEWMREGRGYEVIRLV